MEPLFEWLSHVPWWVIFPILAMAGGAAKAWEQGAKRRHERRLETLRLKGEIKTAQLAARGQALPAEGRGIRFSALVERASGAPVHRA